MRKLFTLFLLLAPLAIACNNHRNSSKVISVLEYKKMFALAGCYSSVTGKDTFNLKLVVSSDTVNGKLSYKFDQKDNLKGDIQGRLQGDTLLADYKFMSEGKISIRQVTFLMKDSIAMEGYGAMVDKNGEMVFKNLNQLSFGKGLILKKINCMQ